MDLVRLLMSNFFLVRAVALSTARIMSLLLRLTLRRIIYDHAYYDIQLSTLTFTTVEKALDQENDLFLLVYCYES